MSASRLTTRPVKSAAEQIVDEVGADESGAAGHQNGVECPSHGFIIPFFDA